MLEKTKLGKVNNEKHEDMDMGLSHVRVLQRDTLVQGWYMNCDACMNDKMLSTKNF